MLCEAVELCVENCEYLKATVTVSTITLSTVTVSTVTVSTVILSTVTVSTVHLGGWSLWQINK